MRPYLAKIIGLLAVVLPASSYSQESERSSISGQYTLSELAASHTSQFSTSLIDLTKIKPWSRFELHVGPGDVLRLTYVDTSGTPVVRQNDIRKAGCRRDAQTIVCESEVPNVGARILPGISKQIKQITYRLGSQGDLQLIRNHIERGWIFYVIPFSENHESSLILEGTH